MPNTTRVIYALVAALNAALVYALPNTPSAPFNVGIGVFAVVMAMSFRKDG